MSTFPARDVNVVGRFGAVVTHWLGSGAGTLGLQLARRRFGYAALALTCVGVVVNTALAVSLGAPGLAWPTGLVLCAAVAGTVAIGRRELTLVSRAADQLAVGVQPPARETVDLVKLAHDLADPLTAASGYGRLLVAEAETESGRRMAQQVVRATDRLRALVADLQGVSSDPALQREARRSEVDVCALAEELVSDYQVLAPHHTIEVSRPSDPVLVWGVPSALHRAIGNLLSNAVRYSPHGGLIRIEIELADASALTLRIVDHGVGIAQTDLGHIFDLFYRGSNAASIAGSGVGLAVVRDIVADHHGSINVQSEVGVGTTFVVQLPTLREPDDRGIGE